MDGFSHALFVLEDDSVMKLRLESKGYSFSVYSELVESEHTSWTESSVPPQCFHSTRHVPYPHIYERFKSFV